jgi:hypothetical protein
MNIFYSILTGENITITGPPERNGMVYGYKRTRLKLKKKKGLFPAEIVNGCNGIKFMPVWCDNDILDLNLQPRTLSHWTQKYHDIYRWKSRVLVWNRHTDVVVFHLSM